MLIYDEVADTKQFEDTALASRRVANLLSQIQRIKRWQAENDMEDALYFKRAIEAALEQQTKLGIHSNAWSIIWQAARLLDDYEFQDAEYGRYTPEMVQSLIRDAGEMGRSLRRWRDYRHNEKAGRLP